MSNVKAGDLAVIIHPDFHGKLVSVLYAEPEGVHTLPDARAARKTVGGASWVCESLGAQFNAMSVSGRPISARYAGICDRFLRPLRDNDGEDEMTRIAGKPTEEQDRLWAEFDTAMSERSGA